VDLELGGKRAIITGGSKGIGRAIVDEFLREGAAIATCARDGEALDALVQSAVAAGYRIFAKPADVTDAVQIRNFVKEAANELGGVDVLVNNAGAATPGGFFDVTDDQLEQDASVKQLSQIRFTREVVPHMIEAGEGRIVNINAVFGLYPDRRFFATSLNRAACVALTKTLAQELAGFSILVNSVNIGYVTTPQWKSIHEARAPQLSEEEFLRSMVEEIPLGRFGDPEEVSGLVAFLAGSRASYITGGSVDVAGGLGRYL